MRLPPGLSLGHVDAQVAEAAAAELDAKGLRPLGGGRKPCVMEAGIPYRVALNKGSLRTTGGAMALRVLPACVFAMIEAMRVLTEQPRVRFEVGDRDAAAGLLELPLSDRVSVIARRYGPNGPALHPHRDAFALFEESVFGLILRGGGPGVPRLFLSRPTAQNVSDRFELNENPGLAHCLEGPARYFWNHGVGVAKEQMQIQSVNELPPERLSLTWRWVRKSTLLWASATSPMASRWVDRFVELSLGAGFQEADAFVFMTGVVPSVGTPVTFRQFQANKTAVRVPWIKYSVLEGAFDCLAARRASYADQTNCALREATSAEVALLLLKLWDQAAKDIHN